MRRLITIVVILAVLAFGTFGFNGILYVIAGELAGPGRSGAAVGVASTVVFGAGAIVAPTVGVAVEQIGYGVLWAIVAAAGALGAAIAWRWLPAPQSGMTQSEHATSRTRTPGCAQCPTE